MNNVVFKGFNVNKALTEIINEKNLNGNEKTVLITISFYYEKLIEENPAMSLSMDEISELVNKKIWH